MDGYVAFIFIEGGDVFVVGDGGRRMLEFVAFGAAEYSSDAVFCFIDGVLLRVTKFSAASMLLIKSEPLCGSGETMMHSMSSGNLVMVREE